MKRKLALASWVVAVILSAVALLLPPTGYIDYSVLLLVAQFLLLCATFLGVDVTVNTEGFYFLYSSILHVCSFVSLS